MVRTIRNLYITIHMEQDNQKCTDDDDDNEDFLPDFSTFQDFSKV